MVACREAKFTVKGRPLVYFVFLLYLYYQYLTLNIIICHKISYHKTIGLDFLSKNETFKKNDRLSTRIFWTVSQPICQSLIQQWTITSGKQNCK